MKRTTFHGNSSSGGAAASDEIECMLSCPYCGEVISVLIDPSVASQRYIEDCEVCCRPIEIEYKVARGMMEIEGKRSD